ncbi:MAG: hypothetical protein R2867_23945 [Caldilineaceae bacterium]
MNVNDRVNVGGFIMIGLLVGWLAAVPVVPTIEELMILWMLVALATIAQFFEVKIADQRTYYPHNVFFFAGVLLLPPMLLAPLYTIPLSVDVWRTGLREGRPTFCLV